MTRLTTVSDPETAAERAAQQISLVLRDALARRGSAHLALAGGKTPRRAYELLAPMIEDWSKVELWYGDERCVDPSDEESNHRLVADSLLAAIPGEPPVEHRIRGELGPEPAAHRYADELLAHVPPADRDRAAGPNGVPGPNGTPDPTGLPVLDVALLGLGEDGHTASLFPGHPEVHDDSGAVCLPVYDAPKPPPERVTLSLPVLRAARHCLLLATGAGKIEALTAVLAGPDPQVPASLLSSGRLHIVIDDAASPRPG